ncbi:MAG: PspC domain-containing protein [Bacteroidetes bacterium]|nr:PspC domain-containing protein [Bacteroidota bacterium]MBU2583870.1 PspC domain-containing protein [Bacteroidota bacterium]
MIEDPNENIYESSGQKLLRCSIHNRMIFGVCGGLSDYFRINSAIIRLIFLIFLVIGGISSLVYIVLAFIIPTETASYEILPSDEIKIHTEKKLFIGWSFILGGISILLIYFDFYSFSNFMELIEHNKILPFILISTGILFIIKKNIFNEEIMNAIEPKKLTLSDNKMIFGVCGGIGEYLNVDPTIIRILWVIFLFASFGIALIIYIILKFIIPPNGNEPKTNS